MATNDHNQHRAVWFAYGCRLLRPTVSKQVQRRTWLGCTWNECSVFLQALVQNHLSSFLSGNSQLLATVTIHGGRTYEINMLITTADRKRVHKLWRAHKPLPQIPLSESGWFGTQIANRRVYGGLLFE